MATLTLTRRSVRTPVLWGLLIGAIQAASPLIVWWLNSATVLALELTLIAAVYIGFAVADGRSNVIAVECTVAGIFVIVALAAVTGSASPPAGRYVRHGRNAYWQ